MKRPTLVLKAAVAVIAATAAFHPGIEAKATEVAPIIVEIRSFKFLPEGLDVSPGDVVVWKNMDIVPHSVTAKDDSWDSALIKAGEEWQMTIRDEMVEAYYCQFHPSMVATLNVERE